MSYLSLHCTAVLAALRTDASFLQYRQTLYSGCSSIDGNKLFLTFFPFLCFLFFICYLFLPFLSLPCLTYLNFTFNFNLNQSTSISSLCYLLLFSPLYSSLLYFNNNLTNKILNNNHFLIISRNCLLCYRRICSCPRNRKGRNTRCN
jgi:hypothetical protein